MTQDAPTSVIARTSLHLELVGLLQPLIINGELEPGTKVPEKELCERFGVSRTPMREALKVLAADGLVRLIPNRGAWVTMVTIDEVAEVFPVLGALEALAGKLACDNITDAEIDAVRILHEKMIASYEARDLDAYFKINQQIHRAIQMAARNDTLSTTCEAFSLRMQRARYLANMSDGRWSAAVQEHEMVLKHLTARDGNALAETLKKHIEAKQVSVLKWLHKRDDVAVQPVNAPRDV